MGEATTARLLITVPCTYFNPRFPWGKRRARRPQAHQFARFQSTLPVGEATKDLCGLVFGQPISIHASRGGSDPRLLVSMTMPCAFQSTLPVGEATRRISNHDMNRNISIHASRGGSDCSMQNQNLTKKRFQSTLPVGEATVGKWAAADYLNISIHASRGGSDLHRVFGPGPCFYDFNPRFPWGKRLAVFLFSSSTICISIHASRGGSDENRAELGNR